MHLIIDITESCDGEDHHGGGCRIPERWRATVLQQDRRAAEQEAMRLAAEHPGRRFIIFEPVAATTTAKIPTHVTVTGSAFQFRDLPVLAKIGEDDEVPF